jgi:hypothetical protein
MAAMSEQQRRELRDDLIGRSFRGAKWRLRLMDPNARLRFHRTNRWVGKWTTRYDLPGHGVAVTLVENNAYSTHKDGRVSNDYEFVDVIVEPLPDVETDPSRTGYATGRPG